MLRKRSLLLIGAVSLLYMLIKDSSLSIQLRKSILTNWRALYKFFGKNDLIMSFLGTYIMVQIIFVSSNAFFVFADLTGRPKWIQKYKIQEDKNKPLDKKKYFNALKLVLLNQLVGYAISGFIFEPWMLYRKVPCNGDTLPTVPQIAFHMLVSICLEEVGFYYMHRLLHHPLLYTPIHKIHHEWNAPVSITQLYCHPLEHLFLNIMPGFFTPILLGDSFGNHLISQWIFVALMKSSSAIVHSGYHLPFTPSSEEHDFHHSRFNQNFGTIGVLDYLHGTNGSFIKNVAYKRHIFLMGLSSAKELVPDEKENN